MELLVWLAIWGAAFWLGYQGRELLAARRRRPVKIYYDLVPKVLRDGGWSRERDQRSVDEILVNYGRQQREQDARERRLWDQAFLLAARQAPLPDDVFTNLEMTEVQVERTLYPRDTRRLMPGRFES